jgi:hypothetical protein
MVWFEQEGGALLARYRKRIVELERCVTESAATSATRQAALDGERHATRAAEAEAARLRGEMRKHQVPSSSLFERNLAQNIQTVMCRGDVLMVV